MNNLLKANSVQLLRFLYRKLINSYILPDDFGSLMVNRVGKSVKNSTDTIFELEILAQKMRAKIRINVQK